jgi:hypothetical protein
MRYAIIVLALLGVLASPRPAAAAMNGNQLHNDCQSALGICLGYTMAIADVLQRGPYLGRKACIPTVVTNGQVRDVVKRALEANPGSRHYDASSLVAAVLSNAFPCR